MNGIIIEVDLDMANEIFFTESDQRFGRSDDEALKKLYLAIGKKVYEDVVKVLENIKI